MKKVRYVAIGMIVCGCIAMATGLAFLFSGSSYERPERDAEAYVTEGDIYLNDGEYMKAIVSYGKALDMDETNVEALRGSAKAYAALEYYEEEEATRNRLTDLEPDNLENWMDIVMIKINHDQLSDAKSLMEELLEKYDDEDLESLYHQMDVREPVFNLEPGSYDSYQMLKLEEMPDNATVYYTLDGKEPDIYSNVYDDGIIISYPENTVKAIAIGYIGYSSDVVELNYQVTTPVEEIKWNYSSSSNLERAIRNKLEKNWDEPVYNYEVAQFQSLYIVGQYNIFFEQQSDWTFYEDYYLRYQTSYSERGQTDLRILSYMPFLKALVVGYQDSIDISSLANLEYLEELSLLNDNIDDIAPIGNLKNIKRLALGWNDIVDVSPLSGLTDLESLGLWNNQIQDVSSLSVLKNLYYFDITGNQVQDISCIRDMAKLSELWVAGNQISDFAILESCNNLTVLMLDNNPAGSYMPGAEIISKLIKTDIRTGGE